MKKFIALCALGVVSVDAKKHQRKNKQLHAKGLSNKMLQQEIEQLRENYDNLEKKFQSLTQQVRKQSLVQGPSPYGLGGPGGPAKPSPQPFVRGEKQWMDNSQNINNWGDHQVEVANTRIPYQSTAQLESPFGLGGAGGPANPSPQPFVRGEKQWMDNGQNINDWGTHQMEVANARIPYASTLQTEAEGPAKYGLGGAGGPANPSPQPFVRGEKQWMDNGQNINDWGTHQMEVANARIPYWSTVQLDSELNTEGPALYGLGGPMGPANPSPQPFVRGEKQWMDNAQNINDWQDHQMTVANTRIPYWSTLVQTDSKDFDQDYEKEVDMNILYEKDIQQTTPEKVSFENIPLSQHLIQLKQDDDPSKIEGMLMEDPSIPLNLRLVHIETKEGDELIKIE